MKLKQKTHSSFGRWLGVFPILAVLIFPLTASAVLTTPRNYLNRQAANLTTGVTMEVFLTTGSAVSGGAGTNKVILIFPNNAANNTKWCKTNGGTITGTGIANPTGATESATSLPGTLAGTCTQSPDTFTITGVDDLSATTKYGVRISGNSSAIGTGDAANSINVTVKTNNGTTDVDTSSLAVSLVSDDQIVVTAVVDVTLSVSLNTNSISLGTLDTTHVNQGGVISQVSTSAGSGYISLVKYDATLTAPGPLTIPNTAGGTIVVGTSEYGAASSDSGNTIGVWSPTACSTTTSTSNATALSTTFQDFASNTTAVTNESTTLCFLASATGTQAPGTYTSTATLVTTARF